jgi:hypothetical protein
MATANPLSGAPRIHDELQTLGVDVSERTVSRLLERFPRPPSRTWRTFLTNHHASAASMDLFTVPTLTGHVLFVLVVLSHQRRGIVHVNITAHPTAIWSAQQPVERFQDDTAPRRLHRDRDAFTATPSSAYWDGFVPGTSEYVRCSFASIAARSPAGAAASFARSLFRFSLRCRRRWISVGCKLPVMMMILRAAIVTA